jgi:hypothetical protein
MKTEEIKIRISTTFKKDFQEICENEQTTMSNKINDYIFEEIKIKKKKDLVGQIMTKKLIKFGVINTNGRLYTKDELVKVKLNDDGFEYTELDKLNSKTYFGQFGYGHDDSSIHKYNATHSIENFRIEEDWLIGDVKILNPSIIPILDKIVFRPRSYGELDDNGVVKNLEIIGFDAILITDDSFKQE